MKAMGWSDFSGLARWGWTVETSEHPPLKHGGNANVEADWQHDLIVQTKSERHLSTLCCKTGNPKLDTFVPY